MDALERKIKPAPEGRIAVVEEMRILDVASVMAQNVAGHDDVKPIKVLRRGGSRNWRHLTLS